MGGLLGGAGGQDDRGPRRGGVRHAGADHRPARLLHALLHGLLDGPRLAVPGRPDHGDPGGLRRDGLRQGRTPTVDGAQDQAGGPQAGALLGGRQQAGSAPAEGLDSGVRVAQDDDLGGVPEGVGDRQGAQEAGGGRGAVLVVVHHDQVGHGTRFHDAVGLPGAQGLPGTVLEAGGVHPPGLGAPAGAGTTLGVPQTQQPAGRPPDGHVQILPQGGELLGTHTQLPGARQQVAQLGAEGPGGQGLGRQTGPVLGADKGGQGGVLLRPGQQHGGGQGGGTLREGGGQDAQGQGRGGAHTHGTALDTPGPQEVGRPATQDAGPHARGGQQDGVPALIDGTHQQAQGQAGLPGAGGAQDHQVPACPDVLQDHGLGVVRLGQAGHGQGRQEPGGVRGGVGGHVPMEPRGADLTPPGPTGLLDAQELVVLAPPRRAPRPPAPCRGGQGPEPCRASTGRGRAGPAPGRGGPGPGPHHCGSHLTAWSPAQPARTSCRDHLHADRYTLEHNPLRTAAGFAHRVSGGARSPTRV